MAFLDRLHKGGNAVLNVARVATFPWLGMAPSAPLMVYVELTRRCNLQCRHCDIWKTGEKVEDIRNRELSSKALLELFSGLAQRGLVAVDLFGGEPLMRPDLPEIISGLKKIGLHVTVTSNGLLLNAKRSQALVEAGLDQLFISIDAPEAKLHDDLRGVPGTFERVLAGVREFQRHNPGTVKVGINSLVCRPTYPHISRMPAFAESLGASQVRLLPYHQCYPFNSWQQDDDLLPRREDLDEMKGCLDSFQVEARLRHLSTNGQSYIEGIPAWFSGELKGHRCVAGLAVCDINGFGELFPCYTSGGAVGSLHESSFDALWSSSAMEAFRRSHEQCSGCWQSCYIEPGLRLVPRSALTDFRTVLHDLREYFVGR